MREQSVAERQAERDTIVPSTTGAVVPGGALAGLLVLWLAGNSLRLTMLSVPPLLPIMHHALHLSETEVGALTALPVLVLATMAIPGSFVIARLGARRALVTGLGLVAAAGALRVIGPSALALFLMTILMGVGIATSQPALPTLVKEWFPQQIARATASYSNGLLIGEILGAALTGSLILPLLGYRWTWALAFWSLPVAGTALAVLLLTPHVAPLPGAIPARWWPDWRDPLTWKLGLVVGCSSATYFGSNAFLPDYLKAIHQGWLVTPALTSLNLSQLVSSVLIAALPRLLVGRRWPLVVSGLMVVGASVGLVGGGSWVILFAGLIGVGGSFIFVLGLSLPPLLAEAHDVARMSSGMFTIMYLCSFLGSLAGGAIWDTTGLAFTAFTPVFLAGLLMAVLGGTLHLTRTAPA